MHEAPPTIETARLRLRGPRAEDLDALHRIQGDRDAMRFTFCAPDREATRRHVEAHAARFREDGFAPWTAVLAASGDVVGWGGLCRDPEAPHWGVEVAYYLDRAHWGLGLATELVEAALAEAFGRIALPSVGAFTRPGNRASARVLEKAGFRFQAFVPELGRNQYRVGAREWRRMSEGGLPEDERAVRLRSGTAGDAEFLFALFAAALGPYVERTYGWDEADQRRRFAEATRPEEHQVVESEGRPVGCLKVRRLPGEIRLDRIFLLPEAQGRGIGSRLVGGVLEGAAEEGLPVRLRCMKVNPARRLYARLGFAVTGSTDTHLLMEHAASGRRLA